MIGARTIAGVLVVMTALVASPARAEFDEAERARLAQQLRAHHILPGHDRLAARSRDLVRYVRSFCALPDEPHLRAVREAFSEAYLAFMSIQHLRFGPAIVEDRHYRLQFWPDKHNQAARQLVALLASDDPVPAASEIATMSVALQGFPALERILFEGNIDLFAGSAGARRCALAAAVSENIETVSSDLFIEWFEYDDEASGDLVGDLFEASLEMLATITELKLKRALAGDIESGRPRRAEAWRSRLSYPAIRANLFALHDLVVGEAGISGFATALPDDPATQGTSAAIGEHFLYGVRVLDNRTTALAEDVGSKDGRSFVRFMIAHSDAIRDLMLEVYPRALNVTVGFNALDGD